ncbi:MAG TPA: hypothetical protein V6C57_08830 [Coleofasciculaceae cyanobacterium]
MHDKQFLTALKSIAKQFICRRDKWSIGIYRGDSPFNFIAPEGIKNPVLTAEDVTDVNAYMVADPFMVWEQEQWYMFFEVMDDRDRKGVIGLATSRDGSKWTYQKIVLNEPFHLSYPYVFKWKEDYYMIPESYQANAIRLYKATNFPAQWSFAKDLLNGSDYVDSSIFQFNNHWWLFTTSTQSDILRLYYTSDLLGDWIEHPKSPIIQSNAHIARPGGRVIVWGDKIVRYTQDDAPHYGNQVRAFEITLLTTAHYQEKEISGNPILKASGSGWNHTGMHNIDPHQINQNEWIACVDGYRIVKSFLNSDFEFELKLILKQQIQKIYRKNLVITQK